MADGELLGSQVDAGRRLLEELAAEGLPIRLAVWANFESIAPPVLYIFTPVARSEGSRAVYTRIIKVLEQMVDRGDEVIDWSLVRVKSPDDPDVREAIEILARQAARSKPPGYATRLNTPANAELEMLYIYSPVVSPLPAPTPA